MKRVGGCLAFASPVLLAAAASGACVGDEPTIATAPSADSGADTGGTLDGGDGGDEAAQPNEAGANSACKNTFPSADFCDDFDNGGYNPAWKPSKTAGFIEMVSTPHFSSPFALSAKTTNAVVGATTDTLLRTQISTAGATEFTLDARVQQTTPSPRDPYRSPIVLWLMVGSVAAVRLQPRTEYGQVACVTTGAQLGGSGKELPFAAGAWHHVLLKAVASGGNVNVSCDVDGTTLSGTVTDTISAQATAQIGFEAFDGQGPLQMIYDDVVFDAK